MSQSLAAAANLGAFAGMLGEDLRKGELSVPFPDAALGLFRLQFEANPAYRRLCEGSGAHPGSVRDWRDIPAAPTVAFKELELTSLAEDDRRVEFRSSGTTAGGQRPSRHFHHRHSLALYETSLDAWFRPHLLPETLSSGQGATSMVCLSLTPAPGDAPHSSLAHMIGRILEVHGAGGSGFLGRRTAAGAWEVDGEEAGSRLEGCCERGRPVLLLGTAFNFVHLLEHLDARQRRWVLPAGSRVMETGGYKGQSREIPKASLHAWIGRLLGVPETAIVCEYGMCELSSQAYDRVAHVRDSGSAGLEERCFRFPPWARARVISPETGREVEDGATGLLRVCDLANVWSVQVVQTEDRVRRVGRGFAWLGRAPAAEARGCSLMAG